MSMSTGRPNDVAVARNRVPLPIVPAVTLSARSMRGLYFGSFRSSATKSNTSPGGRPMTVSPSTLTISNLLSEMAGFALGRSRRGPLRARSSLPHPRRWCETTARLACPRIPAGCVVVGRRTNPVRLPPPPCHPGADDPLADRAPFHTTLLGRCRLHEHRENAWTSRALVLLGVPLHSDRERSVGQVHRF